MSGSGRKSHYRKSVQEDFLHGFPVPEENDVICRALSSRGSNIFEIELTNGTIELAILPNKFKKLIWVKRGDYVIATASQEDAGASSEGKVKFMIKNILNKDQIDHLVKLNIWPEQFILEGKKESDYLGMPEEESDGYDEEEESTLKVDSMGNTIEEEEGDDDVSS